MQKIAKWLKPGKTAEGEKQKLTYEDIAKAYAELVRTSLAYQKELEALRLELEAEKADNQAIKEGMATDAQLIRWLKDKKMVAIPSKQLKSLAAAYRAEADRLDEICQVPLPD